MKKTILVITALLFFCACKQGFFVQRKYTKGIYREHKGKAGDPLIVKNKTKVNAIQTKTVVAFFNKEIQFKKEEPLLVSVNLILPVKKQISSAGAKVKLTDDCGDVIILINGIRIKCKVMEISETEIKYKSCDLKDALPRSVNMTAVKQLVYKNGVIEDFVNVKNKPKKTPKRFPKTHLPGEHFAIAGYVLGVILGILTFFIAPVWAILIVIVNFACLSALLFRDDKADATGVKVLIVLGCITAASAILAVALFLGLLIFVLATLM